MTQQTGHEPLLPNSMRGPYQRPASMTEPMPRYRALAICVRAAIAPNGFANPTVKHMVERNQMLDLARKAGVL